MKLYIIIIHYGELSVTQACVASLNEKETTIFHLIIVNNTNYILSEKDFSSKNKITIINNKKNLGFAAGVNGGIRYALKSGAEFILLLNNDTYIKHSFLSKLINVFNNDSSVGIVAPAIRFQKEGTILFDLGGKISKWTGKTTHNEVERVTSNSSIHAQYVSGCCMLVKKSVFERIGLFDENFFLYYEDVDFCLRTRRAGFIIKVEPSIFIDHELSKSAGKLSRVAIYNQIKSALFFQKKHIHNAFARVLHTLYLLRLTAVFIIKSFSRGKIAILAWYDYFTQ